MADRSRPRWVSQVAAGAKNRLTLRVYGTTGGLLWEPGGLGPPAVPGCVRGRDGRSPCCSGYALPGTVRRLTGSQPLPLSHSDVQLVKPPRCPGPQRLELAGFFGQERHGERVVLFVDCQNVYRRARGLFDDHETSLTGMVRSNPTPLDSSLSGWFTTRIASCTKSVCTADSRTVPRIRRVTVLPRPDSRLEKAASCGSDYPAVSLPT